MSDTGYCPVRLLFSVSCVIKFVNTFKSFRCFCFYFSPSCLAFLLPPLLTTRSSSSVEHIEHLVISAAYFKDELKRNDY